MKLKKTRLRGFKNIHFAPLTIEGAYATPVHLPGAKKFEASLKYELEQYESDDIIDEQSYKFQGGEGKQSLKSLTPEEHEVLFGNYVDDEMVIVRSTDQAPQGAILYERQLSGTPYKRLYCLYNAKFAPSQLAAESMGLGTKEIDEELTFTVGEGPDNIIYISIDTDSTKPGHAEIIKNWYKQVYIPTAEEAVQMLKDAKAREIKMQKELEQK